MTVYYVNSVGGSNTAPYDTWAKGATTLGTVISVPVTNADTIYVASDHSENAAVWAYTLPATIGLRIICVDRTSGAPPTTLATGASVGGGTASTACSMAGNAYFYGISFLGSTAASGSADTVIGLGAVAHTLIFEQCTLHCRGNNATALLFLGPTASVSDDEVYIKLINTALGVGNAGASVQVGPAKVEGVGVTLMGTSGLTNLFTTLASASAQVNFIGCDLTGVTYVNIVSAVASSAAPTFRFSQCKLDPYTLALSTTSTLLGNAEVFLHDCDTGDTHGTFGYFNALGSVVSDTGIKLTAGAAGQSWKVTANANASHAVPFCTPWFGYYNSTLGAAITPYIEVARDVSATAYQHNETWMELLCKSTSTSPASTLSTGRMPLLGTPANIDTGIGTGSWSPGSGSPDWSGKLVLGAPAAAATVTPAENGHIMARVCMAVADTVYVDPQIRT